MARGQVRRDQLQQALGNDTDLIRRVEAVISDNVEYSSITINIIYATGMKSGANQAAAGAIPGEFWVDTTDQSVKRGV